MKIYYNKQRVEKKPIKDLEKRKDQKRKKDRRYRKQI